MHRLRDIVLNTKVSKLEALRNTFAISDIEIHIKSLMIELIDYRLNKNLYIKASMVETCELNLGEI